MEEIKKVVLTQAQFFDMVARLATEINLEWGEKRLPKLYGVPRGGIPVVYALQRYREFEICQEPGDADFIVDDLIDSGATQARYLELIANNSLRGIKQEFVVLIDKRGLSDSGKKSWIVFPWEVSRDGASEVDTSSLDIPQRFLQYIGEDQNRDGLRETPSRVVKSWDELYKGYFMNPIDLMKTFDNVENYDEMIVLRDIDFYSTCEHHLLPFFGRIHIAYLPTNKVIGVSKLARVVECYSRRLQIQERLTQQVANAIEDNLQPLGVGVFCEAQHLCMMARGVEKQSSKMCTTALLGKFRDQVVRQEFFSMVQR